MTIKEILLCVATGGFYIGLAVGLLWLLDRFRRPSKTKLDDYSAKFQERLLSPRFDEVEKARGFLIPGVLKDLYHDRNFISRGDYVYTGKNDFEEKDSWDIAFFQPIDLNTENETFLNQSNLLSFANDGSGNEYYFSLKEKEPAVYFHDHETAEKYLVCRTLRDFLRDLKAENLARN